MTLEKLLSKRLTVAFLILMAGCGGSTAVQQDTAYFDLGNVTPAADSQSVMLSSVDVHSPSWLGTATMQYRLAYLEGGRRQVYSESRWAAPPGELLESLLRRSLASGESNLTNAGCRLRVDLDEFMQVYDSASASHSVIQARVALLGAHSDALLARRALSLSQLAATANAPGGVAAFSLLSKEMAGEISAWLAKLASETSGLTEHCRLGS